MKIERIVRATFSEGRNTVDITIPRGWEELSAEDLPVVLDCLAQYSGDELKFRLICNLGGITFRILPLVTNEGKRRALVRAKCPDDTVRTFVIWVSPEMVAVWLDHVSWIDTEPVNPVRLAEIDGVAAVNAQLHEVSFKTYLMIENYYQGFVATKNVAALKQIERLLYPGVSQPEEIGTVRAINICKWLIGLKALFARQFRNLFRQSSGGERPNMMELMNNQIRILTGGDVTKEDKIMSIDCWRALTELDYKSKEADEIRRQRARR